MGERHSWGILTLICMVLVKRRYPGGTLVRVSRVGSHWLDLDVEYTDRMEIVQVPRTAVEGWPWG